MKSETLKPFFFALACKTKRIFIKAHSTERNVIGPENILFLRSVHASFSPDTLQGGAVMGFMFLASCGVVPQSTFNHFAKTLPRHYHGFSSSKYFTSHVEWSLGDVIKADCCLAGQFISGDWVRQFLQCLDLRTIGGKTSTTEDKKDWSLYCPTGASADGVGPMELPSQAVSSCIKLSQAKDLLFSLFFKLERQVYHSWTRTGYHQPSAWPELTSRQHKATGIGPSKKQPQRIGQWHASMGFIQEMPPWWQGEATQSGIKE